ncbi:CDP-glucose 4,6-dehydratase [Leptolyngbya sp. PCC 6406]|uniref:CDP-glucose 4,6-dehydratase n=1 Tax=Leptolyngbya sp. PCC 6406 TaxID=1173264 RepID=UPI0002AC7570|nr:CDP-glucose 4,6-dehydratase [Leptolyngbya sp. PCC 6406]
MVIQPSHWQNTSVLVTGHTGFKGSWLSLWLSRLGARVHGYALDSPTTPNLFESARVADGLASDIRANILELGTLKQALHVAQPSVIFHLAAQPLVRIGYAEPLETFSTNVIGTANLLEAIRDVPSVKAVVIVTTDKVYDNREWIYPYREIDALGGYDPYSASKAAAELVVASYRASFFSSPLQHFPNIATARAGNVIGGGDWAQDRLIPDCLRSFEQGKPLKIRYPQAVRPWQHVLESLSGYLLLAEKLLGSDGNNYARAWNFGPTIDEHASVSNVVERIATCGGWLEQIEFLASGNNPHEAGLLQLDASRARLELGWRMCWSLDRALKATVEWHQAWLAHKDMYAFTLKQIDTYQNQ